MTAGEPGRPGVRVSTVTHRRLPLIHAVPPAVAAQLALIIGLAPATGAGPVALAAGLTATVALLVLVATGFRAVAPDAAGRVTLGPADVVTLARAVLVATVTALVVDGLATGTGGIAGGAVGWTVVGLSGVALLLDGVDGQVARRTGTSTAAGARFDMEVDAVLLLVLSVHVAAVLGPWVAVIGLMRYAFVAAGWVAPWLRGSLPPSYVAKTIAAAQGIVLVVAVSGLLPATVAAGLVAASLGALCWSFGRSVVQLWTARTPERAQERYAGVHTTLGGASTV